MMNSLSRRRLLQLLSVSALAALALAAGLYAGGAFRQPAPELEGATLYPPDFRPVADFALRDQRGQSFTLADLHGRWNLLFFGFTSCPDICPTTLQTLQQVDAALERETQEAVRVVFVSVDPARDTPDKLAGYLDYFNPEFIGLTGPHEQLQPLVQSFGVYYTRPENTADGGYLVDHSAGVFLVGPDGRPKALFSAPHQAERMARDILRIRQHSG